MGRDKYLPKRAKVFLTSANLVELDLLRAGQRLPTRVPLDLQQALTTTYDRAGYDYALDYRLPIEPPLAPGLTDWVHSLVER